MSDIPRKTIQQSLLQKGFQRAKVGKGTGKSNDHIWYHFFHKGKKYPQINAKISHGSDYKTYNDTLINLMKVRLELDRKKEVEDLVTCPMNKDDFLAILISKGIVES